LQNILPNALAGPLVLALNYSGLLRSDMMNPAQFDQVTVIKKANIYFDGKCISHTIQFDDGSKKTVGVILPTEKPLVFETHVPERMEIISGECRVKIADQPESELYRAGQSFYVPGSSRFFIETQEPLDYVCHLEG
jgi:uncharacterized protein YaiE (UPF0345 family)